MINISSHTQNNVSAVCVFSQRVSLLHACKFYGKLLKSPAVENSSENAKYSTETAAIILRRNAWKCILLAKGLNDMMTMAFYGPCFMFLISRLSPQNLLSM